MWRGPAANASSSSAERMISASISRRSVIPSSVSARVSLIDVGNLSEKALPELLNVANVQLNHLSNGMLYASSEPTKSVDMMYFASLRADRQAASTRRCASA